MKNIKLLLILALTASFLFISCEKYDFDFSQTDSQIVFISRRTEYSSEWSLMIMNNDGSEQKEITDMKTRCERPVISNSGKTLLFVHYTEDFFYELYSIEIDGSNLSLIDKANRYCGSPCWSKDDSKIIYSINRNESTDEKDLVLYDVFTKEKQTLTSVGNNTCAKFSSNNKIAYCHQENSQSSDIYSMDYNGSNNQLIIPTASNPVWSPNGDNLVYQSAIENGSSQIFIANSSGSSRKQLTSTYSSRIWSGWAPDGNVQPSWTPNGKKIVYVSWEDEDPEIKIMNSDGTKKIKLTNTDKRDENPMITNDGKFILFVSKRNLEMNSDIYIMDIDGKHQKSLTNYKNSDIYPVEIK